MPGSPKKRAKREAKKTDISGQAAARARDPEPPAAPVRIDAVTGKPLKPGANGSRKPFVKGQSGNPKGRPKKIYTVLKKQGYSRDDIVTAFHEMAWMSELGLQKIYEDAKKPIIMRTVAHALKKALTSGDIKKIEDLLQYVLGRPAQRIELGGIPGGAPIQHVENESDIDYSKLSTTALREIAGARIKVIHGHDSKK